MAEASSHISCIARQGWSLYIFFGFVFRLFVLLQADWYTTERLSTEHVTLKAGVDPKANYLHKR